LPAGAALATIPAAGGFLPFQFGTAVPQMAQDDPEQHEPGTALVATAAPGRLSGTRVTPAASFLSQLIAERYHLAPQRTRRRATPIVATGAYATGAHIADRRLPAGYRTSRVA
jgi:hypothetical protein